MMGRRKRITDANLAQYRHKLFSFARGPAMLGAGAGAFQKNGRRGAGREFAVSLLSSGAFGEGVEPPPAPERHEIGRPLVALVGAAQPVG